MTRGVVLIFGDSGGDVSMSSGKTDMTATGASAWLRQIPPNNLVDFPGGFGVTGKRLWRNQKILEHVNVVIVVCGESRRIPPNPRIVSRRRG